jgi:F-type H+-transporting ATPase subunit delta
MAQGPKAAHRLLRRGDFAGLAAMLRRIPLYVSNAPILAGSRGTLCCLQIHFPHNPKGLIPRAGAGSLCRLRRCGGARGQATRSKLAAEETIVSGMAGRYAAALFDLAREANAIDTVKADLDRFDALVAESADLMRLVRSPVFSVGEQLQALSAVLQRVGIGGLAEKFLKLVTSNRRLFAVRDMINAFRALVADYKGEATAEVTVAEQLKDDHVAALKSALKAVSGKDVGLNIKIDPAIIGGLVVKLGSRMVDTSLRTKLNAVRHAMKEAR